MLTALRQTAFSIIRVLLAPTNHSKHCVYATQFSGWQKEMQLAIPEGQRARVTATATDTNTDAERQAQMFLQPERYKADTDTDGEAAAASALTNAALHALRYKKGQ